MEAVLVSPCRLEVGRKDLGLDPCLDSGSLVEVGYPESYWDRGAHREREPRTMIVCALSMAATMNLAGKDDQLDSDTNEVQSRTLK